MSSSQQNATTTMNPASGEKRPATAFRDAVASHFQTKQFGENGSPEYTDRGVGSNVLALSQMVRDGDPTSLVSEILQGNDATVAANEIADLIVLSFVTRNTRGGKGEKKLSYDMFLRVWQQYPSTGRRLLRLYPHYGYWKDLLLLAELAQKEAWFSDKRGLTDAVMELMTEQLTRDLASMKSYKESLLGANEAGEEGKKKGFNLGNWFGGNKSSASEDEENDDGDGKKEKKTGPQISLLAKWLPREGSAFDKKLGFVKEFSQKMWPALSTESGQSPAAKTKAASNKAWESTAKKHYRKTVVELTEFLGLPEVLLAAQREDEINFARVASKATMILRKAFLNEDKNGAPRSENPKRIRLAERFTDHAAKKGLKGARLMPHEIVDKILKSYGSMSRSEELVLDAQWKDLWKNVVTEIEAKTAAASSEDGAVPADNKINLTRLIPMADVSGSMTGVPMAVSIAMSIGLSEITHPAFQDLVLTFSSQPKFHQLNPDDTIVKKVQSLRRADWSMSTNFEAAYDLILDVVRQKKLSRADMPSIIVFSDMQFDQARGSCSGYYGSRQATSSASTMHDEIKRKFAAVAGGLGWDESDATPTPIVYWNLRNTGGHPVEKDTAGTVLLAGFSPSLLKLVMSGEALEETEVEVVQADGTVKKEKVQITPAETLRKMLDDALYDPVRTILAKSVEGQLAEYEVPMALVSEEKDEKKEETNTDITYEVL